MKKSLIVLILTIITYHSTGITQAANVSFSETLASSQVAPDGFGVDGWVSQTTLGVDLDKLSIWYWNNVPLNDSLNEYDLGAMYFLDPLNTSFGKFTPFLRAEHWNWPGNGHDDSLATGFNYSGPVNGHLRLTKLITDKLMSSGGVRLYGTLSKEFALKETVSLTPSVTGALLDDFYEVSGMSHITPGIEIRWALSKNINLSGFFKHQLGLVEYPNHSYGGINFNLSI